ncbi:hypothetical protein BS47DRAFT_1402023 [Hydnum rufescens UP504]|uniref:Uncharacterized protein n=1 Tax=Hydnum rufescens UP504 TaxID=1448309 RepID=A0A9P6AER6_9AGAM|nr:hypothetical protein BS47DRAFT_1402023 [Hydnum rufescens UP504]
MPPTASQSLPASQNDPFLEMPQTPGNTNAQLLKELVTNPSDTPTVTNKILEFIHHMKAPSKNARNYTLPSDDFQWLLTLALQNNCNIQSGNTIIGQIATLTSQLLAFQADVQACFEALESPHASDGQATIQPPSSYSQALSRGLSSSSQIPHRPSPAASQPTLVPRQPDLDLTLVQALPLDPVFPMTSFPELKSKIDSAIYIIVTTFNSSDLSKLRASDTWVKGVSPKLTLCCPIYAVIVHRIPTTFNPDLPEHVDILKVANLGVLDNLTHVMWANAKKAHPNGKAIKKSSSLILHFHSP